MRRTSIGVFLLCIPLSLFAQMTWTRATANAGWAVRQGFASVVRSDTMWVIGGFGASFYKDVWSSTDGASWNQATASAQWSARYRHTSVVFNGKLWVLGGDAGSRKNDVWYSQNGVDWTLATSSAAWSARQYHASVVFDGKMWVLGGYDGANKNDVWYSADGVDWYPAIGAAGWSARYGHTVLVFNNKMWVLGGYDGNAKSDVWSSPDGVNWTRETSAAGWVSRWAHTSVVFDNKMWVLGGGTTGASRNDVWYSADGTNWVQGTAGAAWTPRWGHTSVAFDNEIWVLGGNDGSNKNDVWYSDGVAVIDAGAVRVTEPSGSVPLDSGTTVSPKLMVKNYGNATTSVTARFKIGAFYSATNTLSNLAPGDSGVVSFSTWTVRERGTHTIRCSTMVTGDQNPSNDTCSGSVTVRVRDVAVDGIVAPVDTVDSGAVVTPQVVVRNLGTVPETFALQMAIGTFYSDSQNVSSLAAGDSVTVTFTDWTATQNGTHVVWCNALMPGDMVPANNLATGAVTVTPPPGVETPVSVLLPTAFELEGVHPSPFTRQTCVSYALPRACHVSLQVFSATGEQIGSLVDENVKAGRYHVTWDGCDQLHRPVPKGIYFCSLRAEDFSATTKLVKLD